MSRAVRKQGDPSLVFLLLPSIGLLLAKIMKKQLKLLLSYNNYASKQWSEDSKSANYGYFTNECQSSTDRLSFWIDHLHDVGGLEMKMIDS